MRLYSAAMNSAMRLRLGERLARGVARRPETAALADLIRGHDASLAAAYEARLALEPAVDQRSDDVRFGELEAEGFLRRALGLCQELDGDRDGPATQVGFPEGLSAVIALRGRAQVDSLNTLRAAFAESADPTVAAHRAELLALVDQAIAAFVPAYEAWVTAVNLRNTAFTIEHLRRREHRKAFSAILGAIRAAFPEDRRLQDALVPDLPKDGARSPEVDDEPGDTPEPIDPET